MSVIQERVPPGRAEVRHYHNASRQFFYILEGISTISIEEETITLHKGEGIEIPLQVLHQFRNESNKEVVFLVVSVPKSHGIESITEKLIKFDYDFYHLTAQIRAGYSIA